MDDIILVDDCSRDRTVEIARRLGHPRRRPRAATAATAGNQKTCYRTALERGADVVVMVHPDHQYDPTVIPHLLDGARRRRLRRGVRQPHARRPADPGRHAEVEVPRQHPPDGDRERDVPDLPDRVPQRLPRLHARYLETVNLEANSDGFVFDTEIIAQGMAKGLRIREIPIETRYFDEASQIAFGPSVRYGLAILKTMLLYKLHVWGIWSSRIFPRPRRVRAGASGAPPAAAAAAPRAGPAAAPRARRAISASSGSLRCGGRAARGSRG